MSAVRYLRTDGDASEILTLVSLDGAAEGFFSELFDDHRNVLVQITTGPNDGDDFVGLYDLDGSQYPCGNTSWTVLSADAVSPEDQEEIRVSWESGSSVVTRLP